jgi:hypothetical protein
MKRGSLTDKEYALLKKIVDHNEYGEKGCLDNTPWSWVICGDHAAAAVLGSLIRKGLAHQNGHGDDASCGLTAEGKKAYLDHFGAEGTWSNG